MNQNELCDILKDKFQVENDNVRIFLNGEWGIGKSHAWKLLKEYNETLNDKKLKLIYISLFGIDSIDNIIKKIKIDYLDVQEDKQKFIAKLETTKTGQVITQITSNLLKKYSGGTIDLLSVLTPEWDNSYLICFDDLERKSEKIKIGDIMGTIEDIGLKANILLIANENKIPEREKFLEEKEKIIDYEYHLNEISDQTIREQISTLSQLNTEQKDTLIKYFFKHGKNNLRTLRKIKNLIHGLTQITQLDNELIELCSAVVIDEFSTKPQKSEDGNQESTKSYAPLMKYTKYDLSFSVITFWDDILGYLKHNKINLAKIKDFLNPTYAPSKLLLDNYYDYYLKDTSFLKTNIENVLNKFKIHEPDFFLSIEQVLALVAWTKYYNDYYKLGYDMSSIDNDALEVIKRLIKTDDNLLLFRLRNDTFQLHPKALSFISTLKQNTLLAIERFIAEENSQTVNAAFSAKDYISCLKILSSNMFLVPNNAYIFDHLIDNCESSYFSFLHELLDSHMPNLRLRRKIRVILIRHYHSSQDIIILARIQKLINYTL